VKFSEEFGRDFVVFQSDSSACLSKIFNRASFMQRHQTNKQTNKEIQEKYCAVLLSGKRSTEISICAVLAMFWQYNKVKNAFIWKIKTCRNNSTVRRCEAS